MIKFIIYLVFVLFAYSCAPINKQHGYMVDDMYFAAKDIESLKSNKSNKNDVLKALGSPSVKIRDVDDVWIYLVSVKQKNIFEEDEINFIQIIRYEFDNNGNVIKYDLLDKNNFKQIAFSDEKTTITRDAYGISDQIYDAFTRGSTN